MLNFIIVDDNQNFSNTIKNSITKSLFDKNIDYSIKTFYNISPELKQTINNDQNKIYIININTTSVNGIDLAREIRQNDWESQIIFITSFDINMAMIIQNRLLPFDLIYKFNEDFEKRLSNDIKNIIKMQSRRESFTFKNQNSIITIPLRDILYISKDSLSRKCQLVTDNKTHLINDTLTNISSKLNNNFIQTHRACIINIEKVQSIDKKNNLITFENNHTIDLISRKHKKDIINKLKLKD